MNTPNEIDNPSPVKGGFVEKRHLDNRVHEIVFLLMRLRIAQLLTLVFIIYLILDFHIWFQENLLQLHEWQLVSVVAYMGGFVSALKLMFHEIRNPVKREDI